MPELKMLDRQAMVGIAGNVSWHEKGAVLKEGILDGDACCFLYDPQMDGLVFPEDVRFSRGLKRHVSVFGKVAYRFLADGAPLPVPVHRFHAADAENARFMKLMMHEVTLEGGRACFRKPG